MATYSRVPLRNRAPPRATLTHDHLNECLQRSGVASHPILWVAKWDGNEGVVVSLLSTRWALFATRRQLITCMR